MIKVNKKDLLVAVDKAAVGVKETFIFTISDRKTSDGKVFGTVCASNGNVQAMAVFKAEADKKASFIVGAELLSAIKAIGEFGDTITIKLSDTVAEISAGSATMPLPLKADGVKIKMQTPKDNVCMSASFAKDDFIKAIRQGSFAYGDAADISNLAFTVALNAVCDDEGNYLYLMSSDARLATRSKVEALKVNDEFKTNKSYISIDAPALRSICTKLTSDEISVLIFDKQVTVKDGNDYYTIIRYENEFPKNFAEIISNDSYSYKAVFDVAKFRAALKVATLLENKNEKKALINISNGKVVISSVLETNKAQVEAEEVEGEVSIIVNEKHFDIALADIGSNKVTIYGDGNKKPLYMKADGIRVLTAPIIK